MCSVNPKPTKQKVSFIQMRSKYLSPSCLGHFRLVVFLQGEVVVSKAVARNTFPVNFLVFNVTKGDLGEWLCDELKKIIAPVFVLKKSYAANKATMFSGLWEMATDSKLTPPYFSGQY